MASSYRTVTPRLPHNGYLDGAEHVLPIRVYYEDTDFTGVVYHASYLRFFERGRTEFLRAVGIDHRALLDAPDPTAFAVTRLSIQFRQAARIDDALEVRTRYRKRHGIRFDAVQRVLRGGDVLAEAEVELVCIRPDGRPRRLPEAVVAALRPYVAAPAP